MRRLLLLALLLALCAPTAAASDGLPAMSPQGGLTGVSSPATGDRFFSVQTSGNRTLVEKVQPGGGIVAYREFRGFLMIPTVAMDGSASGLSRDGTTLILASPPGAGDTRLRILDAQTLRTLSRVRLPGWWAFDALSPDGSTAFLVHYTAPRRDLGRYEVRAYDLAAGRLLRAPVVDPDEKQMSGMPMTRTTSPDGRFAYTLYQGTSENFIHALDTVGRTAKCIDLESVTGSDLSGLRMRVAGRRLEVRSRTRTLATVDMRTLKVVEPRVAAPVPKPAGGGFPWWIAGVALLALAGAAALRWRGPSSSAPAPPASARRPG